MYSHIGQPTDRLKGINVFIPMGRNFLKQIILVINKVSSFIRKEVWLLEAANANAQKEHSILFTGNGPEKHYIAKLFFKDNYTHRLLGHYWLWQVLFPNRKIRHKSSFSVIQTRWRINKFYQFKKMFCIPTWIFGSIDLTADDSIASPRNKTAKNTLRKVKRGHFKVEVSSDPILFDEFFYKLHRPYVSNRHGKSNIDEGYGRLKARFLNNSEILFVTKGSQRVAGLIICYQKDGALAYRLGVRDGDFQWVKKGAISALYFHTINHCRSKGIKRLRLGGSRPFLSDGVLAYKQRNWNMKIDDYSKHFYFLFKPLEANSFTKDFLCRNPFISLNKNAMVANTFVPDTKHTPDTNAVNTMKNKFSEKGLSKLDIHYFSET